jgi:hypothetical protein
MFMLPLLDLFVISDLSLPNLSLQTDFQDSYSCTRPHSTSTALTNTVLASHAYQQSNCLQSFFYLYDMPLPVIELEKAKLAHLWDHVSVINDAA